MMNICKHWEKVGRTLSMLNIWRMGFFKAQMRMGTAPSPW
jgi:hypothetical protein